MKQKEYKIMATRSRNPENPSDRKTPCNGRFVQYGEFKQGGDISFTLTSVAKDNMVVEIYDTSEETL